MNHSIYSADRMTHLKIVVVALVTAVTIAGVSVTTRITSGDSYETARVTTPVVKATKDVLVTRSDNTMVR
ncbi:MAG: hypothetical protein DCC74_03725 [Proteobacteria bacterium]|nr:MAG: hypothetical protein DCC74_03725 [Pseudomonadota bacterium]